MVTYAEDNPFPSVLFVEHVDPSNPGAGTQRLFIDTDHVLKLIDSSGTVTDVSAGSGLSDPMTTRGDIIIRDASNATARLGIGANGTFLGSDGTDVSWSTPTAGGATGARYPVQTASVASANSNSRTVTFATAPTNGNICFIASVAEGTSSISSIVQTNVTWTSFLVASAGVSPVIELWKGVVSASAGTGAVITYSGAEFHCAVGMEWSGLAGTLSTSATRHVTTDTTNVHPIPILTPTNVTDLVITAGSTTSNGTTFSGFNGPYLIAVETTKTIGVAYGFPGSGSAMGALIGGASATSSGLTASIA